jgi:hypothetical protein
MTSIGEPFSRNAAAFWAIMLNAAPGRSLPAFLATSPS